MSLLLLHVLNADTALLPLPPLPQNSAPRKWAFVTQKMQILCSKSVLRKLKFCAQKMFALKKLQQRFKQSPPTPPPAEFGTKKTKILHSEYGISVLKNGILCSEKEILPIPWILRQLFDDLSCQIGQFCTTARKLKCVTSQNSQGTVNRTNTVTYITYYTRYTWYKVQFYE